MLTLTTPGTGLADLEARLAFGLARLAAETRQPFSLTPVSGRYRITVESTPQALNDAFRLQATRHYASDTPFLLPGMQARYRSNFPTADAAGQLRAPYREADLVALFADAHRGDRNPWSRQHCGHEQVPPFGGASGLILATSSHAGKPPRRDTLSGGNLHLCAVCGLLVVIGIRAACLRNYLGSGRQRLTLGTTLLPQTSLEQHTLLEIFAVQKEVDQTTVCGLIPIHTAPLAMLARYPHLAQALSQGAMLFHLTLYSHGRTDRVDATWVANATALAHFIDASPFHAATVAWLLDRRRASPAVAPLVELTRALTLDAVPARRRAVGVFARTYVGEGAGAEPRLLYQTTGHYLAQEVGMIPRHIIEHDAVAAVADLVRYFVLHRNYGYVDTVRNAREGSHDLERTLAAMLRECRTRRDPESGRDDCPRPHFVPLPDERQVREVITLAQTAFEEVKLALAILGLSRREWEGRFAPCADAVAPKGAPATAEAFAAEESTADVVPSAEEGEP